MKKTFTINISGSIFHIDDDAYDKLQNYLQMLNRHFGPDTEGQEILHDIEARIAELFIEKTANKSEVITSDMIDEMIARMGKPEDFMEQGEESVENGEPSSTPQEESKIRRRLYRDGENRVLGGVCSGMGAYANIDLVIFRILFVLLLFAGGSSIIIYLVLWIAVPKARTTAQRLEMRGKEPTVSNIEKSIKEEVNEVSKNFNNFVNEKNERGVSRLDSFGEIVNSVFRVIIRVLALLLGVALIIGGVVSLFGMIGSISFGNSFFHGWGPDFNISSLLGSFVSHDMYPIFIISIVLLVAIPILLLLFVGTKLLFRYKTNNKLIGIGAVTLWVIALFALFSVSVKQFSELGKNTSQTTTTNIECGKCKTLYLDMNDDIYESLIDDDMQLGQLKTGIIKGEERFFGRPRLNIEKSSSDNFILLVKKQAKGKNLENAQKNIETIEYQFSPKDSTLNFDPYYILKEGAKWRDQELSLTLKVPEGKSVYLGQNLVDIIYDIENVENMWDGDMVGKTWTMTANGLSLNK